MLKEFSSRETAGNLSGRDKQVPAVKDCRFTQTAFGTVVHDSSGKWLGQYETEDAAVEMLREMARDNGGYDDEI
ncbi:MAG: terpene synthase [Coprococcus sp.]